MQVDTVRALTILSGMSNAAQCAEQYEADEEGNLSECERCGKRHRKVYAVTGIDTREQGGEWHPFAVCRSCARHFKSDDTEAPELPASVMFPT